MLQRLHLRVAQKTAEATRDLIGNKIADKIIPAVKSKNKGKEEDNEVNETQEIKYLQKNVKILRFY